MDIVFKTCERKTLVKQKCKKYKFSLEMLCNRGGHIIYVLFQDTAAVLEYRLTGKQTGNPEGLRQVSH